MRIFLPLVGNKQQKSRSNKAEYYYLLYNLLNLYSLLDLLSLMGLTLNMRSATSPYVPMATLYPYPISSLYLNQPRQSDQALIIILNPDRKPWKPTKTAQPHPHSYPCAQFGNLTGQPHPHLTRSVDPTDPADPIDWTRGNNIQLYCYRHSRSSFFCCLLLTSGKNILIISYSKYKKCR
jgi:hypothetical protein